MVMKVKVEPERELEDQQEGSVNLVIGMNE